MNYIREATHFWQVARFAWEEGGQKTWGRPSSQFYTTTEQPRRKIGTSSAPPQSVKDASTRRASVAACLRPLLPASPYRGRSVVSIDSKANAGQAVTLHGHTHEPSGRGQDQQLSIIGGRIRPFLFLWHCRARRLHFRKRCRGSSARLTKD